MKYIPSTKDIVIEDMPAELESDFARVVLEENTRYYDDVTIHYLQSIIQSYRQGRDIFGHFTKGRRIWTLRERGGDVLGYEVITMKRGGAVKSGPLIIKKAYRNRGLGTYFKSRIVDMYSAMGYRKMYATFPFQSGVHFHMNVNKLGWRVEAILKNEYKVHSHECVCSIALKKDSAFQKSINVIQGRDIAKPVEIFEGKPNNDTTELQKFLTLHMSEYYDEIDDSFIQSFLHVHVHVAAAQSSFETKNSRIFIAVPHSKIVGVLITTRKRGGALKCSPLCFDSDYNSKENIQKLVRFALKQHYREGYIRKPYVLVPYSDLVSVRALFDLGFTSEGILSDVYKEGTRICVMSKFV